MTTLSQKEREDLRDVFASISEVKPSHFPKINKLKIVMRTLSLLRRFLPSGKRISYQK